MGDALDRALGLDDPRNLERLRRLLWLLAVALGAFSAWASRYEMDPDGPSYIGIAEAYCRGDWLHALSAYWSPLYSWCIAAAMSLVHPSPYWEYPLVHAINFGVYLIALACFEFLLRQCAAWSECQAAAGDEAGRNGSGLARSVWLLLGYALFLQSSLVWISSNLVTPDLLVEALLFLAAGLLLRLRTNAPAYLTYLALGAVLGLGYLAKTAVFPLALVFLGASPFVAPGSAGKRLSGVLLGIAAFLVVSVPFIVAISVVKGRPTIGDTASLNYDWCVNGRDRPICYELPGLAHPPRKVLDRPVVVYYFPLPRSQRGYLDWSYWCEGERPYFSLRNQAVTLVHSAAVYWTLVTRSVGFLYFYLLALLALPSGARLRRGTILGGWPLLLPAVAGLGMYALVLVDPRYVAPLLVLLWLGLYLGVSTRTIGEGGVRFLARAGVALMACVLLAICRVEAKNAASVVRAALRGQGATAHTYWTAAQALRRLGCGPGSAVAWAGRGSGQIARLARVRLVAPIPDLTEAVTWEGKPMAPVADALRRVGVTAILASDVLPRLARGGWHRLGNTDYYAYMLTAPGPASGPGALREHGR